MTYKQLIKEIKGVFKLPKKVYYFGKLHYGCPYFYPRGFVSSIIFIRKLKLRSKEDTDMLNNDYPWHKDDKNHIYSNLPMVRRSKNWIVKLFDNTYYVEVGKPFVIVNYGLGWKDKYDTPRYEWSPAFHIYFFNWQFCIWWNAPIINNEKYPDNDKYYEMVLWYLKYSDKNIKKAEETWGWVNSNTGESTWEKKYLI